MKLQKAKKGIYKIFGGVLNCVYDIMGKHSISQWGKPADPIGNHQSNWDGIVNCNPIANIIKLFWIDRA